MVVGRVLVIASLLIGTRLAADRGRAPEVPVRREPLAALPLHVDGWHGRQAAPFADDVVTQLGVDDYINRVYAAAGDAPIGLYVGYYESQRQGDTIHSPQNCLPGAGWRPISAGYVALASGVQSVQVNRYVIEKGLDRDVVLYWYQGRGRIVANEYRNKALLMWDAARLQHTNGGLVRIIAPVTGSITDASERATRFATAVLPYLSIHLP
jgi:EpsI family protein